MRSRRTAAWSPPGIRKTGSSSARPPVARRDLVTGRRDLVKEIRPPDPVGLTLFAFLMAADGRSYAYQYYRDLSALFLVEGLK